MINNALSVLAAAEPRSDAEAADAAWYKAVLAAIAVDPVRFHVEKSSTSTRPAAVSFADRERQFYISRFSDGFNIGTSVRAPFDFEVGVSGYDKLAESVRAIKAMLEKGTERQQKILAIHNESRDLIVDVATKAFSRSAAVKLAKQLNLVQEAINDARS